MTHAEDQVCWILPNAEYYQCEKDTAKGRWG